MTCIFFGHRYVQKEIEPMLRSTLIDLIDNHDCRLFYVGNQGGFDAMVTRVLWELSNRCPSFIAEEKEKQLVQIIREERLDEQKTRKFMEDCFKDGEVRTVGTNIDTLMPPMPRFGGGNRAAKKQTIIEKLKAFFERFFGVEFLIQFTEEVTLTKCA